ncbi:MAG: LysM peptidoglycan-binding domain-containing protein [Myxococcota bacterium]
MNRTLRIQLIVLGLAIGTIVLLLGASSAGAAPRDFPQPQGLDRDVEFWTRIYSEVGTDAGLIHDTRNLSLVYEVTNVPSGLSRRARERHTEKRKKHFKTILRKLASGRRSGLSGEERRVLDLFGPNVTNSDLSAASKQVRFQLGQANKFRAGIIRSGAYKPHILQNLRDMNLPLEIAHLPHVESSYTPTVYSRVGAAGLWQFTRSTGRRFMRVDHVVDERLDPYRASIAAARLLEQNLRVTGSWPLAITAYNHGASGMRRAARKLGTKDIERIVRKYRSRTFGFASRNFYVEFLAANHVASNAEAYFGPLVLDQPIDFETTKLDYYAKPKDLASAVGIDVSTLKKANPGLRPAVWNGSKYIPKGHSIRVPRAALPRPLADGVAALPKAKRFAKQTRDTTYTVRRGDTLSTIARRNDTTMTELVALNGLRSRNRIRIGQKIKLPPTKGTRKAAYTKPPRAEKKTAKSKAKTPAKLATATAALPEGGVYKVKRGDNLTRIADQFGMSVAELVSMNNLRSRHRISAGQRLKVATPQQIAKATPAKPAPSKSAKATAAKTAAKTATKTATATQTASKRAEDAAAKKLTQVADVPKAPKPAAVLSPLPKDAPSPTAARKLAGESAAAVDLLALEEEPNNESAVEPSPGLLADPTDYTVGSNNTILVQANETLGHYAEWLGLRASELRRLNGLRYGQAVGLQQKLKLSFSNISSDDFERVRIEFHRSMQEDFFAEWEIEDTLEHTVGSGDSLWLLSTRTFKVPIWLIRQYNPDVDLDSLSAGMKLTVPKLRQRMGTSAAQTEAQSKLAKR